MRKTKILFTDSSLPFVLKALGMEEGPDGNILDSETGDPITTKNGDLVKRKEVAGFYKDENGESKIVKGDLGSIMDFVKDNEDGNI